MSEKKFASQADLEAKKVSFDKLSDHAYAYTAEGDPNTGGLEVAEIRLLHLLERRTQILLFGQHER